MAKILSNIGIEPESIVEAFHVTQSIDAFTGIDAYDISLSGSFKLTGSLFLKELTDTTQLNILTYNPSTYQVFYTSSEAFLYPISSSFPITINNLSASFPPIINNFSSSVPVEINNFSSSITIGITDLSASLAGFTEGENFANADLTFDDNRNHDTANFDLQISTNNNFGIGPSSDSFLNIQSGDVSIGYNNTAYTQYNGGGVDIKHVGDTVISGSLNVTDITQGGTTPVITYNTSSRQLFYTSSTNFEIPPKPKLYIEYASTDYINGAGIIPPNISTNDYTLKISSSLLSEGDQITWRTQRSLSATNVVGFRGLRLMFNDTPLIGTSGSKNDTTTMEPTIQGINNVSDSPAFDGGLALEIGTPRKVFIEIEIIRFNSGGIDKYLIDTKQINYFPSSTYPGVDDPVSNSSYLSLDRLFTPNTNTLVGGEGYPFQVMTFPTFIANATSGIDKLELIIYRSNTANTTIDFSKCRLIQV